MLRAGTLAPRAARFRAEMGLPDSGPLVLSGHQVGFWHGGILTKHFASLAFAARAKAQAAWIVVDQDQAEDPGMRLPIRDGTGSLKSIRWQWGDAAGRIACAIAPVRPGKPTLQPGEMYAIDSVAAGVGDVASALAANESEPNWAAQVSAGAADLIATSAPPPRYIFESRLASTELFQQILDAMVRGGAGAIRCYNEAVAKVPGSGMRALDETAGELPIWDVRTGFRKRVLLADLAKLDRSRISPRGMLMTAILRLAGCDLFVHGTGGGGYDRATESWLTLWNGELATLAKDLGGAIAPMAVATADLRLPLARKGLPTEAEIRRGVWRAHHAAHDPGALGDVSGAAEKGRLLDQIRNARKRQESPAPAFAALHALLDASRRTHAGRLSELRQQSEQLTAQRREATLAFDRTWSFALQPRQRVAALYTQVADAFAGDL